MLLRVVVVALSGFLLSALVAPLELAFYHPVAMIGVFWALRADTPRANRWLAVVFGTVAEAFIFSWIARTIILFSNIPAAGAYAVLALFSVVFGLQHALTFWAVHPLRRRLGDAWLLALPAWVVCVEWALARLFLFPYQQGIAGFQTPWLWQLASVTGVAGLSYLVVFQNAVAGEWIYRRREGRPAPWGWTLGALGATALVLGFGAWRHAAVEAELAAAPTLNVLQLQAPFGMEERADDGPAEQFAYWVNETRKHPPGTVDLVVWPEASVPYQLNASSATATLWDLTKAGDFDLVVGAGTREREPDEGAGETTSDRIRVFNSTYWFDRRAYAPADRLAPEDEARALAASGCDVDAAGLGTRWEADRLARAAEAVGELACAEKLRARAAEGGKVRVDAEHLAAMEADPAVWGTFRSQVRRIGAPLRERGFTRRAGVSLWTLQDSACTDDDCRLVLVRCLPDGAGCDVFPEARHYDKIVPLPFGEYLPFGETFPILREWIRGPGAFKAGTEALVFDNGRVRFGTPICYEGILDYVCDRFEDIDLLVNVTNDAWFGPTQASRLHGMLVTARAIELGVPVFRSAYSGLSFVVEPHGRIHSETALFEAVSRPVEVRLARFDTVYRRFGDWFTAVCAALLLGLTAVRRR